MYQDPDRMPEIMRERRQIGPFYYRFPDGESGADVYDRVDNFVEHLHRMFRRPPKQRGSSRRAHVVSRSDRHGRTRSEVDNSSSLSPPVDSASADSSQMKLPSLKRLESRLLSLSTEGNEEGEDANDTIVIVTHGLTARLFLMRWFHLTVDQFHSLYNMGNCERYNLELRCGSSGGRARYMITHPLRAGGQFPPPHTDIFTSGISSVEACTWGITLDEAAWIWDKYDVTSPRSRRGEFGSDGKIIKRTRSNPNLQRGSLPHATALKFLADVVEVAFPRLVENGYYQPDTDTSAWPEQIYRLYYYDRDAKDLQKHMEWSHVTRILPLDVSEDHDINDRSFCL